MKNKKYKARNGAKFNDEQAQKIGEELEDIHKEHGDIQTEQILERAKDKKNYLHQFFEWDDTEAGRQYRLQQARNLASHVVEVVVIRNKPTEVRSFYSVQCEDRGKVYVNVNKTLKTKDYKNQVLGRSISALDNLRSLIELMQTL